MVCVSYSNATLSHLYLCINASRATLVASSDGIVRKKRVNLPLCDKEGDELRYDI